MKKQKGKDHDSAEAVTGCQKPAAEKAKDVHTEQQRKGGRGIQTTAKEHSNEKGRERSSRGRNVEKPNHSVRDLKHPRAGTRKGKLQVPKISRISVGVPSPVQLTKQTLGSV